ncbi:MAG: hypothetical protein ACJATA_000205 [Sphingobacteriales bacterium]|jgi:hypothetical protein
MVTLNLTSPPRTTDNQQDFLLNIFDAYSEKELVFVVFEGIAVKKNGLLARVISELNMNSCRAKVFEINEDFGYNNLKNNLFNSKKIQPKLKIINLAGEKVNQIIKDLHY